MREGWSKLKYVALLPVVAWALLQLVACGNSNSGNDSIGGRVCPIGEVFDPFYNRCVPSNIIGQGEVPRFYQGLGRLTGNQELQNEFTIATTGCVRPNQGIFDPNLFNLAACEPYLNGQVAVSIRATGPTAQFAQMDVVLVGSNFSYGYQQFANFFVNYYVNFLGWEATNLFQGNPVHRNFGSVRIVPINDNKGFALRTQIAGIRINNTLELRVPDGKFLDQAFTGQLSINGQPISQNIEFQGVLLHGGPMPFL